MKMRFSPLHQLRQLFREELGDAMSAATDKITAAFDDFKSDVSAKLDALTAKVNAASSLSDAEAQPILDDIAAAKAKVDGATIPTTTPTP